MSVLIRGMEMPKNCCDCSLTYYEPGEGSSCIFTDVPCLNIGRQDACPLAPLPEKHGRLIDADVLGEFPYNISFCDEGDVEKWIADAPTIIPAEGGGE